MKKLHSCAHLLAWGASTTMITLGGGAALAAPTYTETALHSFGATTDDGQNPYENGLLLGPDGNFYGMANEGGDNGTGTIFRMGADGTFTTLHSFGPLSPQDPAADAANPMFNSFMLANDGNFYGTVYEGGYNASGDPGLGAIIKLTPSGQESVLHSLQGDGTQEGASPVGRLVQGPDGALYGVTQWGGTNAEGVLFKIGLDGTYTVLHTFCGQLPDGSYDACRPNAGMILASDGNFYGTLLYGAGNDPIDNNGAVYRLSPDGSYEVLFKFVYNAQDGAYPSGALLQGPDSALYGTTTTNVFRLTLDGQFSTLYQQQGFSGNGTNATPDGLEYDSTLVRGSDGSLYGTAPTGGAYGEGIVFKIGTDGSFLQLDYFSGTNGGAAKPTNGVIFGNDGNLYGTSDLGGTAGLGSIYRLDLPPPAGWATGAAPKVNVSISSTAIHLSTQPYAVLTWSAPGADACEVDSNDAGQFYGGGVVVANRGKMIVHPTQVRNGPFYYDVSCAHNGVMGIAETPPVTVTLR